MFWYNSNEYNTRLSKEVAIQGSLAITNWKTSSNRSQVSMDCIRNVDIKLLNDDSL
jgi:hypothetical protein